MMNVFQHYTATTHVVLTVLICVVLGLFVRWLVTRPKNLPPGPSGLPLIGVAWTLMRTKPNPLQLYSTWADEYGDILSFNAGPMRLVILNSYQAIVDAFQHPDLNNRPQSQMLKEVLGIAESGIVLSIGDTWREQRNFVHWVFRNLGVGRKSYEDTILTEVEQLVSAMGTKEGAPFNPGDLLQQAVSNVICSIVFGTQYTYTDTEFLHLLHMMATFMRLSSGGGALFFLPLPGISKIPFCAPKEMTNNLRELNNFILEQIAAHEQDLDPVNPRDFIDLYLNKIAETKDQGVSFNHTNLQASISDLFFAGTETTSTTLQWCVLHMMASPDVQCRVQAELDHVVGRDRLPRLDDSKDLPFTNAVLLEVQRKETVAPLGVPHIAAEDTKLGGYTIPKGATVFANIWRVMHNADLWESPNEFKPERFLDADGKLIKREELIFFSTGRRVCVGERLARMEVFLFFTSLLHRFTFTKPRDSPPVTFEGDLGITWRSRPFDVCAVRRE